jgi:hypothetical protein
MRKGVVCQGKGVPRVCFEGSSCLLEVPPCETKAGFTKLVEELGALARGVPHFRKEELRKGAGDFI